MTLELVSSPRIAPRVVEDDERPPDELARVVTTLIVGIPFVALVLGVILFWGRGVHVRDVVLAVVFYLLTGHGMTLGFHRLLAHKAYRASRPLKIVLVALGSMAYEGGPIGWVANHRRHHVFADTAKDPHTPHHGGRGIGGLLNGLWHAHVGWLFSYRGASSRRHAADLLADRDIVAVNALFPLWCVVSLALPFGFGWLIGGSVGAAFGALFWAGLVRVCVLHHATWSVNSVCHTFGRRPFATKDRSSNVAALAVISMGESWHNGHHAFPRSARHGLVRGQWDSSAMLIRAFERLGWVDGVHRPTPEAIRNSRVGVTDGPARPSATYCPIDQA